MDEQRTLDLTELRRVAEAAAHGSAPWKATPNGEGKVEWGLTLRSRFGYVIHPDFAVFNSDGDAEHAATFDPPTVLALLDELEDLRERIAGDAS